MYAAIQCLTKGGAFKEAIALIRSRLSPQDPVLNETLLVYTDYLEKKRQFGEIAHVCLAIGTRAARFRSIHVLAKTEDVVYLDLALDIVQHDRDHEGQADSEWSLPQSFFIDIITKALHCGNFDVAHKAARLLPSVLQADSESASSASSISIPLARCFTGVAAEVGNHEMDSNLTVEDYEFISSACDEAKHLLSFLTDEQSIVRQRDLQQQFTVMADNRSGLISEAKQPHLAERARHFWSRVLSICKENGISAENPSELDAAQDYLMAADCFAYLYGGPLGASKSDLASKALRRLQVCRRLLQFVLDLESGYLVSGLEHVHEALSIAAEGQTIDEFRVVGLLFPHGLLSLNRIPSMGELGDELADARRLWGSFMLSQCNMLLRTERSGAKTHSIQAQSAMVSQMLEYLREELILPMRKATGSLDSVDKTRLFALMEDVRNAVAANKLESTADTQAVDEQAFPKSAGNEGNSRSRTESDLDSLLALIAEN